MATTTMSVTRRAIFHIRLQSALRTAVACMIVGSMTLYGPSSIKKHITFPAYSYLVAALIVTNAYLGAAIRGCLHTLFAMLLVVPLTMLSIWAVEHVTTFSPVMAAIAVAVISFLVALPKSTSVMFRRVAFGQLVIIYMGAVIHRENSIDFKAHTIPFHVAASTALGAASALLALLLPYPLLAHNQVRKLCGLYAENAAERMNVYLNALSAKNRYVAVELLAKAKPLDKAGNKLLQSIILIQEGIVWERPWMIFTCPDSTNPGDRLQGIETSLRGISITLDDRLCLNEWENEDIKDVILDASTLINLKLQQASCLLSSKSTVPEPKTDKFNIPYNTILSITKDSSAGFFLSCVRQLIGESTQQKDSIQESHTSFNFGIEETFSKKRCLFALKCALSLGLAVLTGLMFDRENSYWTGLIVATSLVEGRQALFTVSNARAQGTAIGSVYGILGCFVFQNYPEIRFIALLPWMFFASFLSHSRMYGQSGGFSAIIGALLILGRQNYGLADEFAIHRLTGAIIGLCCFVVVELLIQPHRASTLVKKQLHQSLLTLQECINQLALSSGSKLAGIRQKERDLKSQVQSLQKLINEAELEPNFWFIPFNGSSYKKVHSSMSNMANLLSYLCYSLECMSQGAEDISGNWKEIQENIETNMNICKETIACSLRCVENLTQKAQQNAVHPEVKGVLPTWTIDIEQATNSECNLQQKQSKKVEKIVKDVEEGDKESKGKMLISLSVWGFCSDYLLIETKTTDTIIKELLYWE